MPFLSEKFDQAVGKNRSCTALVDEAGRSVDIRPTPR